MLCLTKTVLFSRCFAQRLLKGWKQKILVLTDLCCDPLGDIVPQGTNLSSRFPPTIKKVRAQGFLSHKTLGARRNS